MIDRRNISYTQGSYLAPVHKGKLVVQPKDSLPHIKSGGLVSRAVPPKPKKKVSVIDTIGALGPLGLAKVYTSGGAYGSKEAVKTTITTLVENKGLSTKPLEDIWNTEEFKEWTPTANIAGVDIPSIQIDPKDPTGLGGWLPNWDELKTPLIIAGIGIAGLFLAGKFIGRGK